MPPHRPVTNDNACPVCAWTGYVYLRCVYVRADEQQPPVCAWAGYVYLRCVYVRAMMCVDVSTETRVPVCVCVCV